MGAWRLRGFAVSAWAVMVMLPLGVAAGGHAAMSSAAVSAAASGSGAGPGSGSSGAGAGGHQAPGLVHSQREPQRAAGYRGRLLGPSKAVAGKSTGSRQGPAGVPAADRAAAAQARKTGKPVPVPSLTTETSEVLAQPDGEFELVSSTLPSRVKAGGAWRDISTTLKQNQDGSWSAPLTAAPVTFSGGGNGPLVTVTDPASGGRVSLTWPYPVPTPSVSGNTALYANVIPGVDLRLTATATGYSEVLVVHDAAAAADPRLKSLAFTLRGGPGVTVKDGADGTVTVVDSATGRTLFTSGQPLMWDSAPARHLAAAPSALSAGNGTVFTVPSSRAPGSAGGKSQVRLTLTPFSTARTSPGKLKYPLYIDPQINDSGAKYYSEVANFGRTWNTTTGTTSVSGGVVEVGYCGYSDCTYTWNGTTYPTYVVRDYFRMNTSDLQKRNGEYPTVYQADFYDVEEGNSDGCTAQKVAVYSSGAISSSTSWPGPQNSEITTASSAAGGSASGCPAASVDLNVTSYVQSQVSSSPAVLNFELRAPSESNELQYKTFSDNPTLTVWYNFAPLTPTGVSVDKKVTCTSAVYTSDATPGISAKGVDGNPSPLTLDFAYALDTQSGTLVKKVTETDGGGGYASGSTATWTAPTLTSGDEYKVDVRTSNVVKSVDSGIVSSLNSPWSGNYHFTVLSAPPSAKPTIQSFDYPQAQWGQAQGAPGIFTVGTSGDANIAGFAYSFDGGFGSEPVPDTTDCSYLNDGGLGTSVNSNGTGNSSGELALVQGSTAQIMVPSTLGTGRHTLYVRSFDYAHNASAEATYVFYVATNYQATSQPVTYIDGSSLVNSATGTNASLVTSQSDCCGMTTWRGGSQLLFKGTASGQTFTVTFTVPDAGTWQLGADMTTAANYGEVQVDLDKSGADINLGGTAKSPFDGYSPYVSGQYRGLGTQPLTAGTHTLTFTVTGQDSSSSGYELGLVYLTLSPTNRYEADALSGGNNTAGSLQQQCFKEHLWADYCQLMFVNSAKGASFTVSFNAPVESDYALGVRLTTATNYGEEEFVLDPSSSDIALDGTADNPINAYGSTVSAEYVFLGGVHLTKGSHVLKIVVTGADPASTSYDAGIDFLEAAPVTGAKEAKFTEAMNNLGIASDGAAKSGNLDLTNSATGGNLSLQSLEAAGITPGTGTGTGTSFSLGGAQFTMPQLRTNTAGVVVADNVIPDGQTIPLPAVKATGVALLVASTCGASPAGYPAINYESGMRFGNPRAIPGIPDWLAGTPASAAVIRLGYYDAGTTKETAHRVRLYEVMLPANPDADLASITLPVMPTNFLPNTHGCSWSPNLLHVLAIGTRTVAAAPSSGGVWTGAYDGPMDTAVQPDAALPGETLRESMPLSTDGSSNSQVRVRLSNAHSDTPVTFDEVTMAAQASGGGAATVATPVAVTFGASDSGSVTIPAGGDAYTTRWRCRRCLAAAVS